MERYWQVEDILEANRLILDDIQPKNEGKTENSRIMGRAVIESGTVIKDSVVKGPCVVGKNCRIVNSYIGPYTSIGNNCVIEGTEIEDGVIMDGSAIINAGRILSLIHI